MIDLYTRMHHVLNSVPSCDDDNEDLLTILCCIGDPSSCESEDIEGESVGMLSSDKAAKYL